MMYLLAYARGARLPPRLLARLPQTVARVLLLRALTKVTKTV